MSVWAARRIGWTTLPTMLVLAGLLFSAPARPSDERRPEGPQPRGTREGTSNGGEERDAQALRNLLSAAIRARGGLERLRGIRDEVSLSRLVYGDAYKGEVLYKAWSREPHFFRKDMIRDGVLLKCQQYDGRDFVEGYGRRVRFGLEKDLKAFLENVELNRVFSLLPLNTEAFPARLGRRVREDGRRLQEVTVQAPSGLRYALFFDEETHLVTRLEYTERLQYAQSEEVHPIVTHIDSYRDVGGVLVADRLRIFSRGDLRAEVDLVEHRFNAGLRAGFFSVDSLRRELAANPETEKKRKRVGPDEKEWKESAYRKIAGRLETHGACRFREVASYGDAKKYHERLLHSGLSLVVDPRYLENEDVLAFYAEILPGPSGFYEDCIVLAHPPQSASISPELLLHETTHALLRRGQESEPLAVADDEYLTYYQDSLFAIGRLLEAFERISFEKKGGTDSQTQEEASRIWRAAERSLEQSRRENKVTREALRQLREWCGVDFDLQRIRKNYLDLGVAPEWMPSSRQARSGRPSFRTL